VKKPGCEAKQRHDGGNKVEHVPGKEVISGVGGLVVPFFVGVVALIVSFLEFRTLLLLVDAVSHSERHFAREEKRKADSQYDHPNERRYQRFGESTLAPHARVTHFFEAAGSPFNFAAESDQGVQHGRLSVESEIGET
jgi:hypothetical protein